MAEKKKEEFCIGVASSWLFLYTVYQNPASSASDIDKKLYDNIRAVKQENPSFIFSQPKKDIKILLNERVEKRLWYISGYKDDETLFSITQQGVYILLMEDNVEWKEKIRKILGSIIEVFEEKEDGKKQKIKKMVNDLKLERAIEELVLDTMQKKENEIMAEMFEFIDNKKAIILEILAAENLLDLQGFLECQSEILRIRIRIQAEEKRLKELEAENGR